MVEMRWVMPDIYELLRKKGLSGLLQTMTEIRNELDHSVLSSESRIAGTQSYQMMEEELLRKIRNTGDLYILYATKTGLPYTKIFGEYDNRVYLFPNNDTAMEYQRMVLKEENVETEILRMVTGKRRGDYYAYLMEIGAKVLILWSGDCQYVLGIDQVTSIPPYDGFAGLDHPLRNCQLTAFLSDYCQRAEGKKLTVDFEKQVFQMLKEAYFVSPIMESGEVDHIDHKEISFNYFVFQQENQEKVLEEYIPIFASACLLSEWQEVNEIGEQCVVLPFAELIQIMNSYNIRYFALNQGTHNLILDGPTLAKIRNS